MKNDNAIKKTADGLLVPDKPVIPFIEGDGIGVDIWKAARLVVDKAVENAYAGKRKIEWLPVLAGEAAFKATGNWLPQESLQAFSDYLVGIKGPLATPIGEGMRSLNVALRQTLDLYVCLRPVRWFKGVPAPVTHPEKVNMHIFRENTEDIYAGIEYMSGTPENAKLMRFLREEMGVKKIRFPESSSLGIKPVSKEGSQRLVKSAIDFALEHKLPSVTLVHKGNIMKFTEGGFMNWGYEIAAGSYGDRVFTMKQYQAIEKTEGKEAARAALQNAKNQNQLIVKDVIADAFLQEILLHPEEYSVVATLNLNGDYISDSLAAMVGGIGIAPGANINYISGHAIFEATHGTAPALAGKNLANPSSLILSAVMMLEYMGWNDAATLITGGLEKAILAKKVTIDFHEQMPGSQHLSTLQFAEEIVRGL